MTKKLVKPPLGLMPEEIHNQRRALDISKAMKRYSDANYTMPKQWIDELEYCLENSYFKDIKSNRGSE